MVSYVDRHVQNELFILHGVLGEFLRAQSALKGHYLFEVVADVGRQYHLDYDLSHIPVLCFAQQFKYVI